MFVFERAYLFVFVFVCLWGVSVFTDVTKKKEITRNKIKKMK